MVIMIKFSFFFIFLCFVASVCGDAISSDLLPALDKCGKNTENRIFGGEITALKEFPWMALLEYEIPNGKGFFCGGALINNRYILTAAHCITAIPKTWKLISVRLGENNLDKERDCEDETPGFEYCSDPPLNIGIEEQIVHEQYSSADRNHLHDIALLRLNKEVNFGEFVGPICLPTSTTLRNKIYDNTNATVAGWGRTENSSQSSIKLKVGVPVLPQSDCVSTYNKANRNLIESQLCAGGLKGKDSCSGDSGGPLMYLSRTDTEDNWFAIGVVSFGPTACGSDKWPGVYTRVVNYLPWIVQNLTP